MVASILAGPLGRYALVKTGAHVSDPIKIDEPGTRPRYSRAGPNVHTVCERNNIMMTGTVKFYNDQKGFGFIQPDGGDKDVFVHATALERAGIHGLREGQKVKFDTQNDPRSGKVAVGTIEIA
jgi:CspA family cold shock protein